MAERVLVTGAGGFIGSHVVELLVQEGYRVRAFIRYISAGSIGNLAWLPPEVRAEVEIVRGDLRDPDAVRRACHGCPLVVHLAASVSIPYSYVHPREFVETNVIGTLNVLSAVLGAGTVERVVVTSTSEVFGTAQYVPMDEAHPLQPQSPYAASKVAADKLAESFHRSYGLPVVILRPFNTYGPRQTPRAVVPTIILQALQRGRIRLGRLEPRRDLLYVADTAAAFLVCLRAPAEAVVGQTFNVGTGNDISIGELCQRICTLLGMPELPIETEERRYRPEESEVYQLCADSRKAQRVLGWQPQYSLEQGLQMTLAWFREHQHRYAPEDYLV
ncbi:MAG: SDR family NAD(P)-dependent oxidoreductase [Candidatus Kapabacteria bacterium]|nr:SDR family NAD(P)-dependent oxidoreductase [Candidatus Kapabacteria bacterium]MDW8012797.1 SDR family NAD(P)-dependent oxidoreductase [Bacteroidota bacterium]